ncbi:hypothetical protein B0T25DRAFT_521590 [Lasiosphaeria hispida]|uniref:Uncharacterized protein n=1 Tax=Lasiosphaeria hispida TaxID=260671 RepID=A0AAJ0H7X5_9PEZI|nr:hypothetical protein B0T25DRAFT_521590 [Lasiosphaeria hispida]
MYLFRSPLSLLQSSNAGSTTGHGHQPHHDTRWEDTTDLNQTDALPRIASPFFDIKCHVGVIVISDKTCADTSTSLAQKLLAGRVFEHAGSSLRNAREATGRVLGSMKAAKDITGLEFVGCTTMRDAELDLISAGGDVNSKPPYDPIFWNCHDISSRFARVAATEDSDIAPLREVTAALERAKFSGAT